MLPIFCVSPSYNVSQELDIIRRQLLVFIVIHRSHEKRATHFLILKSVNASFWSHTSCWERKLSFFPIFLQESFRWVICLVWWCHNDHVQNVYVTQITYFCQWSNDNNNSIYILSKRTRIILTQKLPDMSHFMLQTSRQQHYIIITISLHCVIEW